nr:glycosyltransferase family 9 protein [Maribacter sp.]
MNNTVHILVIRLSAMGDVAMTVPVILGLVKKYPKVKITVLTKSFTAPIFTDIPNVSVFIADVKGRHKGFKGLWRLYRELKALNIDVVADLHNVLRSTILKQFFILSSIPVLQIDKGRAEKKELINPNRVSLQPLTSTFERYANVFNKLGYSIASNEMKTLSSKPITEKILGLNVTNEKVFIGIAPFAAFQGKMYPLPLMEKVIKNLNDTDKYNIILFGGGKKEAEVLNTWKLQYSNCHNAAGQLSFSDELSLISNLKLMLAMDSGNAHLAAMYAVPTVTIWGITHPYAGFYPFNQPKNNALLSDRNKFPEIPTSIYGNKYPEGYESVMESIKPETVVAKVIEVLNTNV